MERLARHRQASHLCRRAPHHLCDPNPVGLQLLMGLGPCPCSGEHPGLLRWIAATMPLPPWQQCATQRKRKQKRQLICQNQSFSKIIKNQTTSKSKERCANIRQHRAEKEIVTEAILKSLALSANHQENKMLIQSKPSSLNKPIRKRKHFTLSKTQPQHPKPRMSPALASRNKHLKPKRLYCLVKSCNPRSLDSNRWHHRFTIAWQQQKGSKMR